MHNSSDYRGLVSTGVRCCCCCFFPVCFFFSRTGRLEYEEDVTEFVEVSEAMSATSTPSTMPQRRRSRAGDIDPANRNPRTHQAGRGEESEVSAPEATSSGQEKEGQGVEETTEDGEGKTTSSVPLPGRLTEEDAGATAGENGGSDGDVDDNGDADDNGDGNVNVGGNVDRSGPRTGEESDSAPEREGGHGGALDGRETPEDLSPGGNGGSNRSPAQNKASVMKVPRVVTRTRSRAVRVEQTYTGILEGSPLEVRCFSFFILLRFSLLFACVSVFFFFLRGWIRLRSYPFVLRYVLPEMASTPFIAASPALWQGGSCRRQLRR